MTEPFDTHGRLLLEADDAAQAAWEAVVANDANACHDADQLVSLANDAVVEHEMSVANGWLMGMRLALKWYPSNVIAFLDDANELREEWEEANRRQWLARPA